VTFAGFDALCDLRAEVFARYWVRRFVGQAALTYACEELMRLLRAAHPSPRQWAYWHPESRRRARLRYERMTGREWPYAKW